MADQSCGLATFDVETEVFKDLSGLETGAWMRVRIREADSFELEASAISDVLSDLNSAFILGHSDRRLPLDQVRKISSIPRCFSDLWKHRSDHRSDNEHVQKCLKADVALW